MRYLRWLLPLSTLLLVGLVLQSASNRVSGGVVSSDNNVINAHIGIIRTSSNSQLEYSCDVCVQSAVEAIDGLCHLGNVPETLRALRQCYLSHLSAFGADTCIGTELPPRRVCGEYVGCIDIFGEIQAGRIGDNTLLEVYAGNFYVDRRPLTLIGWAWIPVDTNLNGWMTTVNVSGVAEGIKEWTVAISNEEWDVLYIDVVDPVL